MPYPLKMLPCFRSGPDTPWGGSALRDTFQKTIPNDRTGESLEISALPGLESVIANGELAGQPLSRALAAWGCALTGLAGDAFPLLLKLIDAREPLSVQVHPGDQYAREKEGKLGKSEAWLILAAPPGARMVYGVEAPDQGALRALAEGGRLESTLRWVAVMPGDVYYIPHGMIHAIGAGMLLYEIQQASDVTYRLWDWGRAGADGRPRALHTADALAVSRPELRLGKVPGATILAEGGSATAYIAGEHFELWRLNVAGRMPLAGGRMRLLTALGECLLSWPAGELSLRPGESCLVPAALDGAALSGRLSVLCATTPDRQALREALGYRAESVAGLVD